MQGREDTRSGGEDQEVESNEVEGSKSDEWSGRATERLKLGEGGGNPDGQHRKAVWSERSGCGNGRAVDEVAENGK